MTVSYQREVSSSTHGGFTRLLFMWRGSLYKLIYRELVVFLLLFCTISVVYRLFLSTSQKRTFEEIVEYCHKFVDQIPLSFVLGFYVTYVIGRWWEQYKAIPGPDKVMHLVALYVTGNDEYGRMLRRSLMRYLNLLLILVLRSISSAVKRRFPTLDHVVDSGFMTPLELELFQCVPSVEFNTYWIPCIWFINVLKEAQQNHRLPDALGLKIIMEEFNNFRSNCGMLWNHDSVSIPLVYTQVVTMATYGFFGVALVGRQYIEGDKKSFQMPLDAYFPVFTVLQFLFFMGLLKVAEELINPFGDDDEDFELNWLIDRHTKVSYLGVDTLMNRCPPLVKDIFYNSETVNLPYTVSAADHIRKPYRGSVANMTIPEEKQSMVLLDIIEEEKDTKINMTPCASIQNLSLNICNTPVGDKRQLKVRNPAETISLMEAQQEVTTEQAQARWTNISNAVKKISGKSSSSHLNRRPFVSLVKAAQAGLQPWPNGDHLVHLPKPQFDGTSSQRSSSTAIDMQQPPLANQEEPSACVDKRDL